MKIVLSRKGFDSEFGGYPSPILPNGKMIPLPIPGKEPMDLIRYSELNFEGKSLYEIMKELNPKIKIDGKWINLTKNTRCHLDPDIYKNFKNRPQNWRPIFGQIKAAAAHLENQGVKEGDLFLFFGCFRKTKYLNGKLIFDPEDSEKHVIFAYFQIGKVIKVGPETILPEWMNYHPHTKPLRRKTKNNTIYVARDYLSWNSKIPGAGVFNFDEDLVLTKNGYPKSFWKLPKFFKNVEISYHSQENWRGDIFKSTSRGQEFVIQDDEKVEKWAKNLIQKNFKKI